MGWPSDEAYKGYINNNLVINSKIFTDDINRAIDIYRKAEPLLKGKMAAPSQKRNFSQQISLPRTLTEEQKRVQLYIDIFFINEVRFFHIISKDIKFCTIEQILDATYKMMFNSIQTV